MSGTCIEPEYKQGQRFLWQRRQLKSPVGVKEPIDDGVCFGMVPVVNLMRLRLQKKGVWLVQITPLTYLGPISVSKILMLKWWPMTRHEKKKKKAVPTYYKIPPIIRHRSPSFM